jgi:hypothetical protein
VTKVSDEEERRRRIVEKHDAEIARQEAIAEKRELYQIPDDVPDEGIDDFIKAKRERAEIEEDEQERQEELEEERETQKQRENQLYNQKKQILNTIERQLAVDEIPEETKEILQHYLTAINLVHKGKAKRAVIEWEDEGDKLTRVIKLYKADGEETILITPEELAELEKQAEEAKEDSESEK